MSVKVCENIGIYHYIKKNNLSRFKKFFSFSFLSLPVPKSVYVWPQVDNEFSTGFP